MRALSELRQQIGSSSSQNNGNEADSTSGVIPAVLTQTKSVTTSTLNPLLKGLKHDHNKVFNTWKRLHPMFMHKTKGL